MAAGLLTVGDVADSLRYEDSEPDLETNDGQAVHVPVETRMRAGERSRVVMPVFPKEVEKQGSTR